VGFTERTLLRVCERQKVQLQRLLHRYVPDRKTSTQLLDLESDVKVFHNSSPESIRGFPCGSLYETTGQ
jgi:hypothetical protein